MKISEIPHNMNYTINDDMVEIAEEKQSMKDGILYLIDHLSKVEDPKQKGQIACMAGVFSRIVEDFEASEKLLSEAVDYFKSEKKDLMVIYAKSRLATTLYSANKYSPSDDKYEECLKLLEQHNQTPGSAKIQIYCLDHLARSKYLRKFYAESLDLFLEAHEAEMIHGDINNMNLLSEYIAKLKKVIEEEEKQKAAHDKEQAEMEENFKKMESNKD